jgi:hypothetical protein
MISLKFWRKDFGCLENTVGIVLFIWIFGGILGVAALGFCAWYGGGK